MEVKCGKYSGFCAGVRYTVNKATETIENAEEKIYCLGEIVHNERVIKKLEDSGMITVNCIEDIPDNSKVIFRAHGEAQKIYEKAQNKNIDIIDLTCGKIRVIREKIKNERNKSFIIIIGKKEHPETVGTISFAGNNSNVIEKSDDILPAFEQFNKTNLDRVFVVAQTTFSSTEFDLLVSEIKNIFSSSNVNIIVDKTICDATEIRQKEALEFSKDVDKMIIIGGKHSSNTKELAKIAEENCKESFLIQTIEDLKPISFSENDKVGVIAGASTPEDIINEVVDYLKNIKGDVVHEL